VLFDIKVRKSVINPVAPSIATPVPKRIRVSGMAENQRIWSIFEGYSIGGWEGYTL
jgi:hypothetical protein